MNRRSFLTTSAAAAAISLVPLSLTGCDTTTVAAFVTLIGKDAATLATYFGQTTIANDITSLAGQIAVDITNWQSGSSAANAIASIDDLIGLINNLPVAVPYAPLVVLILSALTGLLALLPNSLKAATPTPKTHAAVSKYHVTPYHCNGFDKHSMTQAKSWFTGQWSTLVASTPGLSK
jgi:hypothetical protein